MAIPISGVHRSIVKLSIISLNQQCPTAFSRCALMPSVIHLLRCSLAPEISGVKTASQDWPPRTVLHTAYGHRASPSLVFSPANILYTAAHQIRPSFHAVVAQVCNALIVTLDAMSAGEHFCPRNILTSLYFLSICIT